MDRAGDCTGPLRARGQFDHPDLRTGPASVRRSLSSCSRSTTEVARAANQKVLRKVTKPPTSLAKAKLVGTSVELPRCQSQDPVVRLPAGVWEFIRAVYPFRSLTKGFANPQLVSTQSGPSGASGWIPRKHDPARAPIGHPAICRQGIGPKSPLHTNISSKLAPRRPPTI
jgi:hypothetical protein